MAVQIERTRFFAPELRGFIVRALVASGVSPEDAALAGDVLVASDIRGIESHGLARLELFYVDRILDGTIDPRAVAVTLREGPGLLSVDAKNGMGHPVSVRTMRRVIEKARSNGSAAATVTHSNHFGIAGYYAMLALEHDMIGIASTNSGGLAAPTFGKSMLLGTNPLAYAIPAEDGDSFVLDMATTTVAYGKLEIAKRLGKPLKPGWAIDADGNQTLDPAAGMRGALLPLGGFGTESGGHKGYGLGLLVDILCGVLGGGAFGPDLTRHGGLLDPSITSHFFAAIRIDAFRDPAEFRRDVSRLLAQMRGSAAGAGGERVYTAGEPEAIRTAEHLLDGIGLDPVVVASLQRVAEKLGIDPPQPV
jgi:LDH2 family malate/lactate/ureidoglycolate dehydrogenase